MRFGTLALSTLLHIVSLAVVVVVSSSRTPQTVPVEMDDIVFVEIVEDSVGAEAASERETPPPPVPDPPPEPAPLVESVLPPEKQEEVLPKPTAVPASAPERARIVSVPTALNRITPRYPRSARRQGHEGRVTVEATITEEGTVASVTVVESSGHADLDRAAVTALRQAEFVPAKEDDRSVVGTVRLPIEFRLR